MICGARTAQAPFWNRRFLEKMATDHVEGRNNYVREIDAVLTLEAVERLLFRDLPYEVSDLKNSCTKGLQEEPLLTG